MELPLEQKGNFYETRGCGWLHPVLFFILYFLSLFLFLFIPLLIHDDRGRNYYFLTFSKRLILQRSIYRIPRWQPSHVGEWHREWLRFARTVESSTLHTILRRWLNRLPSSYSSFSFSSSSCSFSPSFFLFLVLYVATYVIDREEFLSPLKIDWYVLFFELFILSQILSALISYKSSLCTNPSLFLFFINTTGSDILSHSPYEDKNFINVLYLARVSGFSRVWALVRRGTCFH